MSPGRGRRRRGWSIETPGRPQRRRRDRAAELEEGNGRKLEMSGLVLCMTLRCKYALAPCGHPLGDPYLCVDFVGMRMVTCQSHSHDSSQSFYIKSPPTHHSFFLTDACLCPLQSPYRPASSVKTALSGTFPQRSAIRCFRADSAVSDHPFGRSGERFQHLHSCCGMREASWSVAFCSVHAAYRYLLF